MHRRGHQRPIRLSSRILNINTTTSTSFCPVAVNVIVTATNRESSTQTSPPAFSIQKTLAAIQKQLEVSNSRQSELDRFLIQQQQKIDTLLAITRRQQTPAHVPSTPSSPPRTPTLMPRQLMPDSPSTSTIQRLHTTSTNSSPQQLTCTSPVPEPLRQHSTPLPMHLFYVIPDVYRISENDLNIAMYSTNSPGMLATNLLRLIFPELFNADNLQVYYSYFGGGKLKKISLDQQRKSYLKRYLVTFYPDVNISFVCTPTKKLTQHK